MGDLVVKSNFLVDASHKLGEAEQRLILLAIAQANDNCKTMEELRGQRLTITTAEYMQRFGVSNQTAQESLRKAVMGLYRAEWGYRFIDETGDLVVCYERFTQSARYIKNKGVVSFVFADAIIQHLMELQKNFTKYQIREIADLSSKYAMRLYELIIRWVDTKKKSSSCYIKLEDLRFHFGLLPTEYKQTSEFKRNILDVAVNQINEKTNLKVSYEQKKQGRVIVGFRFDVKLKKGATLPKIPLENDATNAAKAADFSGLPPYILAHCERWGVDFKTLEALNKLEAWECETVFQKALENIDYQEKITAQKHEEMSDFRRRNILQKAVAEKWGVADEQRKAAAEQAEKERAAREAAEREKAAADAAERQAKDRANNERKKQELLEVLAELSEDEKTVIFDEVAARLPGVLGDYFQKKREDGGDLWANPLHLRCAFKVLSID